MKTLPFNAFSDQSRDRQGATVACSWPKPLPYGRGSDGSARNAFSDQSRDRQGATVLHSLPKRSLPYGRGSDGSPIRCRGTVILLVVAVLALLAVIGTIYIVSARTEKANAQSMEAAYNLELARDAIMQQTVQAIGNSLLDSTGAIAGYNTTGTGGAISHNYDYPDASEPWLAATLHLQTAPSSSASCSQLTSSVFDPATGQYDLAPTTTVNVVGDQTANATDPYSATNPDGMPTAALVADAYYNLLPFSDASGIRYRYGIRIIDTNRMANLNTGATADDVALSDSTGAWLDVMRLAPAAASYPTGTVDYFNQNDQPNASYLQENISAPNGLGRAGYSTGNADFGLVAWQHQLLRFEEPDDPAIAPFDLADELELRSFGEFGTPYHIRAAVAQSAANIVWPYTLSAEGPTANYTSYSPSSNVVGNPGRRNYTTYSESQDLRPYPNPPIADIHTLTYDTFAQGTSAPAPGSLPSGTPTAPNSDGSPPNWPAAPAMVSANPQASLIIGSSNSDIMYYTAMAATNIATLMEFSTGSTNSDGTANTAFTSGGSGTNAFTHEEACAFAANYCTAKWNGFTTFDSNTAVPAYYLPAGPSFVDNTGICIRSASGTTAVFGDFGNGTTDLHSETTTTAHKVYLGYSAQPFFSEVAATMIEDDSKGTPGVVTVSNTAVELYNPYNQPLSLNGYHLKRGDGTGDIDLTGPAGNGNYVPANGYFVIVGTAGHYTVSGTATTYTNAALQANTTGNTQYILYRPYYPRGSTAASTPALAPVDEINYSSLVAPNAAGQTADATLPVLSPTVTTPVDFSISRSGGLWGPDNSTLSARSKSFITLGAANNNSTVTAIGYPLPDRFCPTVGTTPGVDDPLSLGEFARITRIANEFDGTNSTGALITYTAGRDGGLVADHIAALTATTSPYTNMVLTTPGSATDAIDAQILFDFYGDPATYSTTAEPTDTTGLHDIRAARLLQQLAFIDRYSEFNIIIDPTVGATDINKIRLPGRINVNTAAPDVLRAIPNMTDQMVANIVAYRSRLGSYTYNGTASSTDFSNATKYPGSGIRSISELLVPLTDPTATTIDQRDQRSSSVNSINWSSTDLLWGRICNLCTVRSDTFVVYGYLEAVKQNPNYTGTFDNASMWYTSPSNGAYSSTLTIDNPHNTGPLVRVGRRRFLAIVDRSFCNQNKLLANGSANPKFILPKIVAIKDLPDVPGAP